MVWTANPKPNFSYKISVLIPASQEKKKAGRRPEGLCDESCINCLLFEHITVFSAREVHNAVIHF